jgi:hypothetical protein
MMDMKSKMVNNKQKLKKRNPEEWWHSSRLNIHVAQLLNQLGHIRILVFVAGFVDGLHFNDQILDLIDDILGLLEFELLLLLLAELGRAYF